MLRKIVIIYVIITLVGLSGCLGGDKDLDKLKGLSYSNNTYGFGLNPPEGWTTDESDDYGAVRFYGPTEDEFTVNFGLSEPFSMGSYDSLGSIISETIAAYQIEGTFENFVEISNNSRTVNEMNAHELVYSYTLLDYEIYGKQVIVEKNRKVVIFTLAALATSYNTYLNDFEQSLSSFILL